MYTLSEYQIGRDIKQKVDIFTDYLQKTLQLEVNESTPNKINNTEQLKITLVTSNKVTK